ncbi:WG repeat-containing protein [Mucilaginibacter sp. OK098]|uniref:WG repeat-containing protein n=1 Tax=Mucilaginibacter sp. OK098 TaxID=1855297 RepID=UPI00091E1440|nr:WG repeat-containing protein [Mucilaginibacter sp. OK098]SHM73831.1 WG containing repeat-containing protein [Mucilaginibacter sp. OK098]
MKTRPFLSPIIGTALVFAVLLLAQCKSSLPAQKTEINAFLAAFNKSTKANNTDSLVDYFDNGRQNPAFNRLVNLLIGRTGFNGDTKAIAAINLDVDGSDIKFINEEIAVAHIPAKFSHDSLSDKQSVLTLTLHKVLPHKYKITVVDAKRFLADYVAYESFVRQKTMSEKDIFSPITLAAFKAANLLKTKYDSVVWFAHVDQKTFYYVVKGKWAMHEDINRYKDSVVEPYKMGLVNPELKEIIPPEYDLIHNISGTFPGLVEVEKDNKKGFYDLDGKIVVPVSYDQVLPINDDGNLAVLRSGGDYFYLKQDLSISEKVDLKIGDFISKVKNLTSSFDLYKKAMEVVTEYNSKTEHGAIYIAPSYLVEMNLVSKESDFKNPLRKIDYEEVHTNYQVSFTGTVKQPDNWLEASFYSIRDYFLGGRGEFYDKKNIVIVDKKNNRIFTKDIMVDYTPGEGGSIFKGLCDINNIKAINDSLYEVKAGAALYIELYDSTKSIEGGPYYHYLAVKNNKLVELPNNRNFGFTKYVKMDDSYLNACYNLQIGSGSFKDMQKKTINQITPEMLRYMKNEIFADYAYQFKDKRWVAVFEDGDNPAYNGHRNDNKPNNPNVDDSLTVIDKYNVNWINQKLNGKKTPQNTIAAK